MIIDKKNLGHYLAEDGKVIIVKGDEFDEETKTYPSQTKSLWLGKFDSIENYNEVDEIVYEQEKGAAC